MKNYFTLFPRIVSGLKYSLIIHFILIAHSNAANYQSTVIKLSPTYYYELNETTTEDGALDTMGNAPSKGEYNGDYGVGGPEVGGEGPMYVFSADDPVGIAVPGLGGEDNLAHYSNNSGHITLGDGNLYGSSSITVALFFKAGPAQGGDRLFLSLIHI